MIVVMSRLCSQPILLICQNGTVHDHHLLTKCAHTCEMGMSGTEWLCNLAKSDTTVNDHDSSHVANAEFQSDWMCHGFTQTLPPGCASCICFES